MKISPPTYHRRAFTLIELMFATTVGLVVAGSVVMLMFLSAQEQRRGLAAASVEENTYILQSKISTCLRSASGNQGITPDYSTPVLAPNGLVLGYETVLVFTPTNGGYVSGRIKYTAATGTVIYTPNLSAAAQELWMTNSATSRLTNFLFSTSLNLDGSPNSSLVNVSFLMDDNGYTRQNTNNNLASVIRSFCIQMRND